jgi:hypothetical protein
MNWFAKVGLANGWHQPPENGFEFANLPVQPT